MRRAPRCWQRKERPFSRFDSAFCARPLIRSQGASDETHVSHRRRRVLALQQGSRDRALQSKGVTCGGQTTVRDTAGGAFTLSSHIVLARECPWGRCSPDTHTRLTAGIQTASCSDRSVHARNRWRDWSVACQPISPHRSPITSVRQQLSFFIPVPSARHASPSSPIPIVS